MIKWKENMRKNEEIYMDYKSANKSSISLKITGENIGQVINVMNNLTNKRGIRISLSFDEKEQESILTIYPNIMNRNDVANIVATSSEQAMDFDNASDITKEMLRLHETLRVYGFEKNRMNSVIELQNGLMGRNFNIKHTSGSYDYVLDNELAQSPFTRKKDSQGYVIFSLGEKDLGKDLETLKRFNGNLMSHLTQNECKMVESDEFLRLAGEDFVRRQIRESIVGKNGDKILAEVFDDIGLARDVADKTLDLMNRLRDSGVNIREALKQYPVDSLLTTKVSKNQAIDIVKGFFKSLDIDVTELFETGKMTNEKGQEVNLSFNDEVTRNEASSPTFQTDDINAYVKETGTLTDVYALVHEISHTFYVQNGFNEARMILGEVVPQCMERLLDGYLENLTESQNRDYGFDKTVLREDIRKRQISTAIDRLDISKRLANNKYQHAGKKAEFTRYMLAQLYSTQFMKFEETERKEKLFQFISAINDNNIQQANEVFELEIDKQRDRSQCINDSIENLHLLLTVVPEKEKTVKVATQEQEVEASKIKQQPQEQSRIEKKKSDFMENEGILQKRIKNKGNSDYTKQDQEEYEKFVAEEPEGAVEELIEFLTELHQTRKDISVQVRKMQANGENVAELVEEQNKVSSQYYQTSSILTDFVLKHQTDSQYINDIIEQMPFMSRAAFINESVLQMMGKNRYGLMRAEYHNAMDVYERNIDKEIREMLKSKSIQELSEELYMDAGSISSPFGYRSLVPKYDCINFTLYRIDEELETGIFDRQFHPYNLGGKSTLKSTYGYGRDIYADRMPPNINELPEEGDFREDYIDSLYWAQKITTEDRTRLGLSEINAVTAEMRKDLTQTQEQEIETK